MQIAWRFHFKRERQKHYGFILLQTTTWCSSTQNNLKLHHKTKFGGTQNWTITLRSWVAVLVLCGEAMSMQAKTSPSSPPSYLSRPAWCSKRKLQSQSPWSFLANYPENAHSSHNQKNKTTHLDQVLTWFYDSFHSCVSKSASLSNIPGEWLLFISVEIAFHHISYVDKSAFVSDSPSMSRQS